MSIATPNARTMGSMKLLDLNRIAIWRPKLIDDFTIRESGAGRPFVENKILSKTTAKTYRYAKNYERDGNKFCLFVVTYSKKAESAEKQLDKIAKKVEIPANLSDFEYTNYYLEDK